MGPQLRKLKAPILNHIKNSLSIEKIFSCLTHPIMCVMMLTVNINKFLFSFFLLGLFSISSVKVFADTSCQPVYGGGQNCVTVGKLLINKTVQNPQTGQFVDNLGTNDPKYGPGQVVTFQIQVTNTNGSTIPQTVVRDIIPGYVTFVSGPGNFDTNSKTLTFTVDNLNPNETRSFSLQGKIVDAKLLPTSSSINCVVNQASATSYNGDKAMDNAQFCIQNVTVQYPVLFPPKTTTTPPTGPEMIPLMGLIPTGIAGWFMRRKSFEKNGGTK